MKLLTDILTGKDNLTYDAARVVGVLGAFAYIVFWCLQVWTTRRFEPAVEIDRREAARKCLDERIRICVIPGCSDEHVVLSQ